MKHQNRHIPTGPDNFLSVLEGIQGGFAIFAFCVSSFRSVDRAAATFMLLPVFVGGGKVLLTRDGKYVMAVGAGVFRM